MLLVVLLYCSSKSPMFIILNARSWHRSILTPFMTMSLILHIVDIAIKSNRCRLRFNRIYIRANMILLVMMMLLLLINMLIRNLMLIMMLMLSMMLL